LGYKGKSRAEIQRVIVCSEGNQKIFQEIINTAKERFETMRKQELAEKQRSREYKWDVPAVDYFNERYERVDLANYVMAPCLLQENRSKPEKNFEELLSGSGNISWWYKNREAKETYFAIPYSDPVSEIQRSFYPDYVVEFKNGTIGIYDTKSGMTASSEETGAKSDALVAYLAKDKKRLRGGIVVFDKTGSFVFTGKQYNVDLKAKGWERLEI
jgi:type III restriction enzyme